MKKKSGQEKTITCKMGTSGEGDGGASKADIPVSECCSNTVGEGEVGGSKRKAAEMDDQRQPPTKVSFLKIKGKGYLLFTCDFFLCFFSSAASDKG